MKEVYPLEIRQGYADDDMCVMMLYEPTGNRKVPILIGRTEAEALVIAIEGHATGRPLTHELISNIFRTFNLELTEVSIDRIEEGIFYASLHLDDIIGCKHIDARASDAVIMAIRESVPIKMAESVLQEAGFPAGNDDSNGQREPTLEELEAQLRRYEATEDYEHAAEIMEKINKLKG